MFWGRRSSSPGTAMTVFPCSGGGRRLAACFPGCRPARRQRLHGAVFGGWGAAPRSHVCSASGRRNVRAGGAVACYSILAGGAASILRIADEATSVVPSSSRHWVHGFSSHSVRHGVVQSRDDRRFEANRGRQASPRCRVLLCGCIWNRAATFGGGNGGQCRDASGNGTGALGVSGGFPQAIEDTYNRYQQFSGAGRNMEGDQNRNDNKDEASSDLQSTLREIATWSPKSNNTDESDADELENLENLLRNALRDTRSRKMQMLAKQNSEGSTSGPKSSGAKFQDYGSTE